ncbi:MFS transporter [Kineococcus sp. TBRC 1896]|uniref:MFS transporter n=1 Tax=Kineococcus mangrovi TaxID=1660183 RepID=A0ABV4I9R4_9ACTN
MAAGAGLIAVTYGVVRFGFGLQLTQLSAEFSLTPTLSGLIASGSFAAYCVSALTARRVTAHRGARTVLWLATASAVAGALLVSVAWTAAALAAGVLIAGSAAGAASPALVVAVSATAPPRAADRRQAVVNAGTGAGVVAAGLVALFAPSAWRPVWIAAAVAAVVTAAVVDRRTDWPRPDGAASTGTTAEEGGTWRALLRPVLAATLAGLGSAAVWTFGRDLLTTVGGLPERTTAVLWVLLGATAVLGALSGDAVRVLGLRRTWVLTVALSAASTCGLAAVAADPVAAGVAAAVFGGSYTALSGTLIAWAGALRPHLAGATTATLFIALTAGQAVGSPLTGSLTGTLGAPGAFTVSAALLASAAVVLPRTGGGRGAPRR